MDICNRALSFWSYQQCQESNYHDVLRKKIENRYMQLDKRLQMTIQQANAEIVSLHSMFEGTLHPARSFFIIIFQLQI